jgi:nitroreductase
MELIRAIRERRSIRAYRDEPVEREKLLRVLEAGRLAPSSRNEQEWKFVVVQKKETIEKLYHACREEGFVKEAPVVIAACGTKADYVMRCGQPAHSIDVSIAVTHMILRAADLGLGTCWLGSFYEDKVKEALGIPPEVRVVAVVTLGYSRFQPQPTSRKRLEDIVCFDRWR